MLKHVDVASSRELGQISTFGMPDKDVIITGPAKPERWLGFA